MKTPDACPYCGEEISLDKLINLKVAGPALPYTCSCGRKSYIALSPDTSLIIWWDEFPMNANREIGEPGGANGQRNKT